MGISWSLGSWLPVLRHLPATRSVALTVDDAPTPETMPAILDILDSANAKATFFVSGCRAVAAEELVAETIRRGHAVYSHGWEHIRLDRAGNKRLRDDMDRCENLLSKYRPTPTPYLVRMPYNGGYRNSGVHRTLAQWQPGCQIAHWRLSTEDHLISTRCRNMADVPIECGREVSRLLTDPKLPGAIILMHDQPINERPGAEFKAACTIELTRQLVTGLSAAGYAMVLITPAAIIPWWSRFALS